MTPEFLDLGTVLEIHKEQLALYGGQDGIRDRAALESAVAMPEAAFGGHYLHPYPYGMAAAYAYHLAENQPFVDGNKRVALNSALFFLSANGIKLRNTDELYSVMIDMGNHRLTKENLARIFEEFAEKKY